MPRFGACWKLGALGQGCSATCGGAQFTDPALTVALGSSSELVEALCAHEELEPPNRHAEAFDRTCEPPANSRFFTARFLYFPEVRSWDCFPGESIEDIAPVFRSPCACAEPPPPPYYAQYAARLCASTGCAALSSLAFGFCLALCLAWCFLCFCRRRQPPYHGDYGYSDHRSAPKAEAGYAGGEVFAYSGRSYRGSGGFDENYGVIGPLGSLDCLRLQIRLQYCWMELGHHARRGFCCSSLRFRLQRCWSDLVYQAGRCFRGCCHCVGGLSSYGYPPSYYGEQLDGRWRGTLSSPRGGTHRRSPEGAHPGSYSGSYSGSYASTPRYPARSPRRPEALAGGQPYSGAEVRAAFDRFDANGSGRLDYRELRAALRAFGLDVDSGQATAILQQYDADGNGLLDLDEFSRLVGRLYELNGLDRSRATPSTHASTSAHAGASPIAAIAAAGPVASASTAHRWSDSEVRAAFDRFDANGSGRLDYHELRAALRALAGLDVDSQDATAILQQYDADGNGLLDLDEFGSLVRRLSSLSPACAAAAKTPGHAVRSTPSTPPRVAWAGRQQRSKPDLDAGGSTLRSYEERPREPSRESNTVPRPWNAHRDRQPTMQTVGGGIIWGGAGPPPPGKQKPPQQTFFPPATRAPSGYCNEQMSMH